jgi:hypothetical protein
MYFPLDNMCLDFCVCAQHEGFNPRARAKKKQALDEEVTEIRIKELQASILYKE